MERWWWHTKTDGSGDGQLESARRQRWQWWQSNAEDCEQNHNSRPKIGIKQIVDPSFIWVL